LTVRPAKTGCTILSLLDSVNKFGLSHFSGGDAKRLSLFSYFRHLHWFGGYLCSNHFFPFQPYIMRLSANDAVKIVGLVLLIMFISESPLVDFSGEICQKNPYLHCCDSKKIFPLRLLFISRSLFENSRS
jgi:hypothetical protein